MERISEGGGETQDRSKNTVFSVTSHLVRASQKIRAQNAIKLTFKISAGHNLCRQHEQINTQQEQKLLQKEQIQELRDEIVRLKGNNPCPTIRPSTLEKSQKSTKKGKKKRPGSAKRSKTADLIIHETVIINPNGVPEGSRFLGYEDFTVQDIKFCAHNTRYRRARWLMPDGKIIIGKLPEELSGKHFDPALVCFVLYQYYHAHVTQPLIQEHDIKVATVIARISAMSILLTLRAGRVKAG